VFQGIYAERAFGPEIDLPLTVDLIRDTLGDIPAQSSFGWNLNENRSGGALNDCGIKNPCHKRRD
jgi:hypothetical protein